jgi:hypothetical protein
VHEKSFPLSVDVLAREVMNESHRAKLLYKNANGFFPVRMDDVVIEALPAARKALLEVLT